MILILHFVSVDVHTGSSHVWPEGGWEGCVFVLFLVSGVFVLSCPFQSIVAMRQSREVANQTVEVLHVFSFEGLYFLLITQQLRACALQNKGLRVGLCKEGGRMDPDNLAMR